jgi:hypothetical protein
MYAARLIDCRVRSAYLFKAAMSRQILKKVCNAYPTSYELILHLSRQKSPEIVMINEARQSKD